MKTKVTKTRWFAVLLTAIMVLTLSCKGDEGPMGPMGPAGPKGEQGIKGDKGEIGNANVKYTDWVIFDAYANWTQYRSDFTYFKDDNSRFKFSTQTIKDIANGKYVSLCYVKNTNHNYIWTLPAFFANGDFTEFGNGRKMLNYAIGATSDGSYFQCEINLTSTDGTAVKGAQEKWYYQLVFIAVEGGVLKSTGAAETLQQELQKLSYQEVCQRYGIEQ